jgi:hypothetical protein
LALQPSQAFGSKKSKSLAATYKLEVASLLKISPHLMNQEGRVPLTLAYEKYKACHKAMQDFTKMKGAKTWPTTCPEPTTTDIIEIFISKSMWHQYYSALFSHVSKYPDMVDWLEDGEDKPSSVDVWGFQKISYNFSDLKKWLDEQKSSLVAGMEKQMDKKEKAKEKKKEKGKKAKRQTSSEESSSEGTTRGKKKSSKEKQAQGGDSADEESDTGKILKGKQKAKGGSKNLKKNKK